MSNADLTARIAATIRRVDGNHTLGALDWALARRPAASLPEGSIVASQTVVFLKDHPTPERAWSCTDGGHAPDEEIDRHLGLNAKVLRVGTGENQE